MYNSLIIQQSYRGMEEMAKSIWGWGSLKLRNDSITV